MDLEEKLKDYKERKRIIPNEEKIKETVRKSMDVFYLTQQERLLGYGEFLWMQFRLIRKRWWIFQLLLLFVLGAVLPSFQIGQSTQRIFGIAASLFIILVVPELWKSQTYQSMEIEAASYYSLQQIYAARMLLFGIVDIVLITVFCGLATITMQILFSQLFLQFIFPMIVTACICFGILGSRYSFGKTTAIMMCMIWNAVWTVIVLDERIYAAITFPLWFVFLGTAFAFFAFTVYRLLRNCNDYWEVNLNGTDIG